MEPNDSKILKYNQLEHRRLLDLRDKEGGELSDRNNLFSLCCYSTRLADHLIWENRSQFYTLIEQFLNEPKARFRPLCERYETFNKIITMLETERIFFEPNPKSRGFALLIDDIVSLNELYCPTDCIKPTQELIGNHLTLYGDEKIKEMVQELFIEMKEEYF